MDKRAAKLLFEELDNTLSTWYLSFAAEGKGFLGAILVRAHGFIGAIAMTHVLGINPGGEVIGGLHPDVPDDLMNRLLSDQELREKLGATSLRELEEEATA